MSKEVKSLPELNKDVSKIQSDKVNTNDGYLPITAITRLTQAEYDAITTKNPETLYVIVG